MGLLGASAAATYNFYPRPSKTPVVEPAEEVHTIRNWSNTHAKTSVYVLPESLEELENVVKIADAHKQKIRPPDKPSSIRDIVFDTSSGTWHKAASFFYTSCFLSDTAFTKKGMITSSGSLLLITTTDRQDHSMVVFNPINKTKKWIPKMPRLECVIHGNNHGQGSTLR